MDIGILLIGLSLHYQVVVQAKYSEFGTVVETILYLKVRQWCRVYVWLLITCNISVAPAEIVSILDHEGLMN